MKNFKKYPFLFSVKSVGFWIFAIIVVIGFSLRTYNFSDWMQFGPDQGRNAMTVGAAVDGIDPIPTLGPLAAGSNFKLGAIFYQFQFFSAKIFGNNPVAMALPDLFFGIILIPCLFFMLRKLFSLKISLALTAIMSVSYFFIVHARFSSNPNAIPLFVLLFLLGIFEMTKNENAKKYQWPLLLGIGMGVGIQQHTILFVAMPAVALGWAIFLFIKKRLNIQSFLIVLVAILVLNSGQLLSEYRTGGNNFKEFMTSLRGRSGGTGESRIFRNVYLVGACQVQANMHFISSVGNIEECGGVFNLQQKKTDSIIGIFKKNYTNIVFAGLNLVFTLLGYFIFIRRLQQEKDEHKKMLLYVLLSFNLVTLLIMIPVATEISLRYFIVLFFVPFVFLGFIAEEFLKRNLKYGKHAVLIFFIFIFFMNVGIDFLVGDKYINKQVNDAENSIFGETKIIAGFIKENACASKKIYFDGQTDYAKRFFKPLKYMVGTSGIELISMDENPELSEIDCIFYVTKKERIKEKSFDKDFVIEKTGIFGGVAIHLMHKNNIL